MSKHLGMDIRVPIECDNPSIKEMKKNVLSVVNVKIFVKIILVFMEHIL